MLTLPSVPEPPASYRLEIPADAGWLTLNQRQHWAPKSKLTRHYRESARIASLAYRLPAMEQAHVVVELRFTGRRRRDPANWGPTAKAVIDGLVDAGVFPDDDHAHIDGPDMRIGPVDVKPLIVVHIWPRPE